MSIDVIDKFEQKSLKKIRSIKNTWYDWLISYVPEIVSKIKFLVFLRQTHMNKLYMGEERSEANQKHKTLEILLYLKRRKRN